MNKHNPNKNLKRHTREIEDAYILPSQYFFLFLTDKSVIFDPKSVISLITHYLIILMSKVMTQYPII